MRYVRFYVQRDFAVAREGGTSMPEETEVTVKLKWKEYSKNSQYYLYCGELKLGLIWKRIGTIYWLYRLLNESYTPIGQAKNQTEARKCLESLAAGLLTGKNE